MYFSIGKCTNVGEEKVDENSFEKVQEIIIAG